MSGPVDLGQTYRYRYTVEDSAGVPANAGTVTVTVTLPDGTTAVPSVVNSATGVYDIAYTTIQSGLHNLRGSATGGVLSSEFDTWEDAFTVETPLRMFIGLDEASAHLRAGGIITTTADREQLRWLCMVACDAVERDLGRTIARRTVTEVYDGSRASIILRSTPVISITSVTESGTALGSGDYVINPTTGLLYRGSTLSSLWFAYGRQNVTVVYVAGFVDVPRIVRKVALNGVQRAWQQSQQAAHPALEEFGSEAVGIAAGALTPLELAAYNSLRAVGIA